MKRVDLNCDLGEGVGNEAAIMPLISSCNIACGGHAGDPVIMAEVITLALKHNVAIGAHPSYPDRKNFGRKTMTLKGDEFIQTIQQQIAALRQLLDKAGATLHHIKAHGALYNDLAVNPDLADRYLDAVDAYKDGAKLFVPYNSVLADKAVKAGFTIWYEAFADRNYTKELTLVPRNRPGALITDPQAVLDHLLRMVIHQEVRTLDNTVSKIQAQTYCLHGDTPNALEILTYLSHSLPEKNVRIN